MPNPISALTISHYVAKTNLVYTYITVEDLICVDKYNKAAEVLTTHLSKWAIICDCK